MEAKELKAPKMMEQDNSIIDAITGGNAIQVNVNLDLESIALLASGIIVAIVLGNIISASIIGK